MPDIKDSVGEGGAANHTHDVALVQAMLKIVKNAKGQSYLVSNYDGAYGKDTKDAIIKFQTDYKIVPADKKLAAAIPDTLGKVTKSGPTIAELNKHIPATHKSMMIMANTKTVYLEGDAKIAKASSASILGENNLDVTFRTNVSKLVDEMYKQHKIALQTTNDGRRRTFAEQAVIPPPKTFAGPGESNHNFGRAVDIGFRGLQWIKGDGTIHKEIDWLNALEKADPKKATAFWDARDQIAINKLGLFRLQFERVHLQDFDQKKVNMARSLADLLNTVGTTKWAAIPAMNHNTYTNNFGLGKNMFNVGKAKAIWNGQANVTAMDLATAKGVKAAQITPQDIKAVKTALQNDFKAADVNWKKWKGVP